MTQPDLPDDAESPDGPSAANPDTPDSQPSSPGAPQGLPENVRAYWRANIRLIVILLVIWAVVSYGCGILFVEQLNQFKFGALPLGFWFAQQGSIYTFVVLIFVYAWRMDKLDRKHEVNE